MSQERQPSAELNDLASALRELTPRVSGINREELMFHAGRASGQGSVLWPAAACFSALTALFLGALLLTRPEPATVERIVLVPVPTVPSPGFAEKDLSAGVAEAGNATVLSAPSGKPWRDYHQLQDQILSQGLDGLPPATVLPSRDPEITDTLLRSMH
jgi:hypothetical protein